MGIPRFFRFISKNFPNIYKKKINDGKFNEQYPIDNLYLDANGIIHRSCQNIFFNNDQNCTINNNIVFENICSYFDHLLYTIKPLKLFYIAIDGTAPLAKQTQQRQRRYKSVKEKSEEILKKFDNTSITPGTEFMYNLGIYIKNYIKNKQKNDLLWKNTEIIFSDSNVPGEGEHKIVNYIRKLKNKNNITHCMYGLDADLFMLSLTTHCENFYLLREDQFKKDKNGEYFYIVNIKYLREEINLKWNKTNMKFKQKVINDFVFICFLIGNDFLHNLPSCYNLESSIPSLMFIKNKILNNKFLINTDKTINKSNLLLFFKELLKKEKFLISKLFYSQFFPNLTLNNSLIDINNPNLGINMDKYRNNYYNKIDVNLNINYFCSEYLKGLEWVQYYYHNKPKNWRWFFPFHYSPLLCDLCFFLENELNSMKNSPSNSLTNSNFEKDYLKKINPINPFLQLLCVVPPQSKRLIPKFLQKEYSNNFFQNFFPLNFVMDFEGKTREWEGIALIPFINIEFLEHNINFISPEKEERKRNKISKPILFKTLDI